MEGSVNFQGDVQLRETKERLYLEGNEASLRQAFQCLNLHWRITQLLRLSSFLNIRYQVSSQSHEQLKAVVPWRKWRIVWSFGAWHAAKAKDRRIKWYPCWLSAYLYRKHSFTLKKSCVQGSLDNESYQQGNSKIQTHEAQYEHLRNHQKHGCSDFSSCLLWSLTGLNPQNKRLWSDKRNELSDHWRRRVSPRKSLWKLRGKR